MTYTAKQIDRMSIEQIEELACTLNPEELTKWTGAGYDGATYVKIVKNRHSS
jgi:hypothetical protein